mmetsp:Transcript_62409/g.165606  ORF Transcript_62409/g.165606 Transcript_62409/m.165606 type:complete len:164 (+) Transcript_62409:265-756(+)
MDDPEVTCSEVTKMKLTLAAHQPEAATTETSVSELHSRLPKGSGANGGLGCLRKAAGSVDWPVKAGTEKQVASQVRVTPCASRNLACLTHLPTQLACGRVSSMNGERFFSPQTTLLLSVVSRDVDAVQPVSLAARPGAEALERQLQAQRKSANKFPRHRCDQE